MTSAIETEAMLRIELVQEVAPDPVLIAESCAGWSPFAVEFSSLPWPGAETVAE